MLKSQPWSCLWCKTQPVESFLSGSSVKHGGGKNTLLLYYFIEAIYYSLLKPEVVLLWQM